MNAHGPRILLCLGLMSVLSGCRRAIPTAPEVPSLADNLPRVVAASYSWAADAYLVSLRIPVGSGPPGDRIMDAGFRSESNPEETLLATLRDDGSITIEALRTGTPLELEPPIAPADWTLTAADALDLMLNEEGMAFLEAHEEVNCSFLKLERSLQYAGAPVTWRLVLTECLSAEVFSDVLVDASTGEGLPRAANSVQ